MGRRFLRWMVSVFVHVRADDDEGRACEKDRPVADIEAASSLNSKSDRSPNHRQLLKAFVALFSSLLRREHDTPAAIHNKRHAPNPKRKAVSEFMLVHSCPRSVLKKN